MKIYVKEDQAHLESDLLPLIAAVELGDAIERHLIDANSPLSAMLDRARDEFMAATHDLIDADLITPEGIAKARILQATVQRYRDMCRWITDALEARNTAADQLDDEEEDVAVEELKDMLYGNARAKPAHDA